MKKADYDESVSGFELTSLEQEDAPFGFRGSFKLFLSYRTSAAIHEAALQKEVADKLKEAKESEKTNAGGAFPEASNPFLSSKGKSGSKEFDIDTERERLLRDESTNEICDQSISQKVYDAEEPLKLLSVTKSIDREARERNKKIYEILAARGNYRQVVTPHWESVEDQFKQLDDMHPSFESVTDFVKKQVIFAHQRGLPLEISPFLMFGPHGLGKSRYTADLGSVLSSPIFRLSYDSAHTSSTLLGSDKNWGNSTAGLVFEAVCASPLAVANPILMLDEIDKSRKDGGYQDPLASLHSLTEPLTSKSVTDISLGFTFSAGHVIWIAAANYQHLIPETILSRFHVFEIQPPTGWGAVRLAQSVCRDSYAKLGTDFMEPGRELIRLIYHLSAREQRKVWEQAYANAVSDGRLHLEPCDFPHDDDERKSSINKKQWTH